MARDPAFLFYSSDFLTGTMTLSFEDRGKYITLLSLMHQQGRIDEETISLLVGSFSVKLKSKFRLDENNLWYNERLELETKKRNEFTESRRNNGLKGDRPKESKKPLAKPKRKHKVNLMEDVNEDINYYIKFDHLELSKDEFKKLIDSGFSKGQIDETIESIQNYKKNTNYVSLYLTLKKWLKKDKAETTPTEKPFIVPMGKPAKV